MSDPAAGGYVGRSAAAQLQASILDRTHYLTAAQARAVGLTEASDE